MPQSYGITADHPGHPDSNPADASPTSPLLRDHEAPDLIKQDGHAGILSSVSNLANTILGTGMLTFPLAMASGGLIIGVITCVFSGTVAALGLYLLSRCADKTPHRRSSFFAVAQLTFPKAAVFFDAAIAIKCFGVSISYLIIIKSLMPLAVASLYHVLSPNDPPAWALSGRMWITLFMAFLVPLSFLKRLNSLRHTSYVALFSVAYLVAIVIYCYFVPPKGSSPPGDIHLIHFTPSFISTYPVQVFAFTCAQNLFPIYNELRSNKQSRMNIVIGTSIGTATLTYEVVAVFGYLTFGSRVGANIIAMYPATTLFIAGGQMAIVIMVMFSYPLQVHPCRNCLDKVFHDGLFDSKQSAIDTQDEDDEEVDPDHNSNGMSSLKHTFLTSAIIISTFSIAFLVNDLKLVLSFVGSTGSTTISFILPGLFFYKLFRDDPNTSKGLKRASIALCVYGCLVFVFCLSFNIYQVVRPKEAGRAL